MDVTALVIAMSIPSAITGFCFWLLERRIQKRDEREKAEREKRQKEIDERDAQRREYELCQIDLILACVSLSEATANAVERIPDAHCNGDMHKALDYAQAMKNKQKEFLRKQAVRSMDF